VHCGRPKKGRILNGDVTVIDHYPSSMIQRSVKILEEGLFEWTPPNLSMLKNFPTALNEDIPEDDIEELEGFSSADRSSVDRTAPFKKKIMKSLKVIKNVHEKI